MALKVEVQHKQSLNLPKSREDVFAFLDYVPISIGECFPNVEEFQETGDKKFLFKMKPIHTHGLTIKLHWESQYYTNPDAMELWWETDEESGNGGLNGRIVLRQNGNGCTLELSETFWIFLKIPRLAAGIARGVTLQILKQMTDDYMKAVNERLG